MPSFEKVLDDFALYAAKSAEDKAHIKGYIEGKTKARKEVLASAMFISVVTVVAMAAKALAIA